MTDKFSDAHVIEASKDCATYAQLHAKLGWSLFASTVHAAKRLGLNLVYVTPNPDPKPLPPKTRTQPKPVRGKGK